MIILWRLNSLQYCGHSCSNALEQSSCGDHGQCKFTSRAADIKLNLRWCWLDWLTESHIYTSFIVHRGWKSGLKKQEQQLIMICRQYLLELAAEMCFVDLSLIDSFPPTASLQLILGFPHLLDPTLTPYYTHFPVLDMEAKSPIFNISNSKQS